jgi:hypothetical protein
MYLKKKKKKKMWRINFQSLIKLHPKRGISLVPSRFNKTEESQDLTHFGFETVKANEKTDKGEYYFSKKNFKLK